MTRTFIPFFPMVGSNIYFDLKHIDIYDNKNFSELLKAFHSRGEKNTGQTLRQWYKSVNSISGKQYIKL